MAQEVRAGGAASPEAGASEEFQFIRVPPEISFATREVPPPAPAYVSPDEYLRIEARNSLANIELHIHSRLLKPSGEIVQSLHSYTPTSDRQLNTWSIRLAEGYLIGVTADVPALAKPGACYVRVLLIRGTAPILPIAQVLLAGYAVTGSALVWPAPRYVHPVEGPGWVRVIQGTTPAPGDNLCEVVPTGARWRVRALSFYVITSSTPANRYVGISFYHGVYLIFMGVPIHAQGASAYYTYSWAVGAHPRTDSVLHLTQDALPEDLVLVAGDYWYGMVWNAQATDQILYPILTVEEWIEP